MNTSMTNKQNRHINKNIVPVKKHNIRVANKEWKKTIKFNNHWFTLKSIFDKETEKFDFNDAILSSKNINFNKLIKKLLKRKRNIITKYTLEEAINSKDRAGNPDDEFYTRAVDIKREYSHYIQYFKGKVIYCNCDNPKLSKIYNYLKENYNNFKLSGLYSTYYDNGNNTPITFYDGINEQQWDSNGDGSFDSEASIEILKNSDIIISNPPFGPLVIEYLKLLLDYNKDYICVAPLTVIDQPFIQDAFNNYKMFSGYTNITRFDRPDGTEKDAAVVWLTSFDTSDIIKYNYFI